MSKILRIMLVALPLFALGLAVTGCDDDTSTAADMAVPHDLSIHKD